MSGRILFEYDEKTPAGSALMLDRAGALHAVDLDGAVRVELPEEQRIALAIALIKSTPHGARGPDDHVGRALDTIRNDG